MAKKASQTIEITCPCCQAKLTLDPQLAAVLSHEPPPKAAPNVDLTDTARILSEQERQREEKYRQSVEAERKKADLFDRLFEENLKKAKEQPIEKPIRDFDLD
jgi:hypothetical protein